MNNFNIENTKLICDFMEYRLGNGTEKEPIVYVNVPTWYGSTETKGLSWFHFDKDWNMLMQVVEKIELLEDYRFDIASAQGIVKIYDKDKNDYLLEEMNDCKKKATYNAVVNFIQYYNKQKQN